MKNKRQLLLLGSLFTLAFLIRLISLNQSLWLDEATTAKVVHFFPFFQIIAKFSPTDFHPPLYYIIMKLWTGVFGYSEIALRFPSVIFSLLTGYFVYLIGKKIRNQDLAFWATAFFLFNPLIVYYSQEARMYALALLFLTIALYYFLKSLQSRNLTSLILFSLFIILSFYTFYGSVFLIAAFFIFLVLKKKYRLFLISGLIFSISLALISPLLLKQLDNSRSALLTVVNWKQVLGPVSIKNLGLIFIKFAFGRISFYPKKIYYLLSGIWTLLIFYLFIKGALKNSFLAFLFLLPIFLGAIFSLWSPLLQYFRFLYLIPILSILLSYGLSQSHQINRSGCLAIFMVLSLVYLLNPVFHREDWRSLVNDLKKDEKVFMVKSSSDPVVYYSNNVTINDLRTLGKNTNNKITVIPYTSDIHGIDYQKDLINQGYKLLEKKAFRELMLERWTK